MKTIGDLRDMRRAMTARIGIPVRAVVVLGSMAAILGAAPASRDAGLPPTGTVSTGEIRLILRGAQQGSLFMTSCGASSVGEIKVGQFTDLTDPSAPDGVGTFSLKIPATCVAPLLTALFHHETLTGAIGFFDTHGAPVLAFSLGTAYVAHVGASFAQDSKDVPLIILDVVSPSWLASVPTSSSSGSWANPSSAPSNESASTASSTPSGATASATHTLMLRSAATRQVAIAPRKIFGVDLGALRAHRVRLGAVVAANGGTSSSGSSDSRAAIVAPHITATLVGSQTTFPTPTFQGRDFGFDVRAALGPHGESTGAPTTTFLPIHAAMTENASILLNAAQHHEPMQSATIAVLSGSSGQPVLTIVPHAPVLTSDHVVTLSGVTEQELTVSLSGMTVTDATSGRTVTSSP